MNWDFDQGIERRGTDSFKWDANDRLFGKRDLLPFWVADMDFATPEPVIDGNPRSAVTIRFSATASAPMNTTNRSRTGLRERHQWDVPREWMMFCPPEFHRWYLWCGFHV